MCGVLVIFSKKKKLDKNKCLIASKEIYNRGPDNFQFSLHKNKTLFIANTVLSITGNENILTKHLRKSLNKKYEITFNGEIYNYKSLKKKYLSFSKYEKEMNDTDVLINLYEQLESKKIPTLLNGMFAYVVFDKIKDKLIIVNDVQGEKNFYKYEDDDYLIISSNIKSILKFNSKIELNLNTVKDYFKTRHFMPMNETCFKKINLLNTSSNFEFNLKNNKFVKLNSFNIPHNLISKKLYFKFSKMCEKDVISYFEKALLKQAKLMIPNKKFGCIISGGIDSSLQAALINKLKISDINLCIDHKNKDPIMKYLERFNKYFNKKIKKITINTKKYKSLLDKCYQIVSSPIQTHDLPSRLILSRYFKSRGCKVFFSADGCDELLGGQQIYKKIYSKKFDYNNNISPYSTIVNRSIEISDFNSKKLEKIIDQNWQKTMNSYNFIRNKKEKNIQSSLFLDYFIQATNVGNRSNDLICCDNSVEPRNIFIQKDILKIIVNLPLKYKINFKTKNKSYMQKYILKKIFAKYLDDNLIFKKSGFSGFPNSLKINRKLAKEKISKILNVKFKKVNNYYDQKNFKRDMDWKILNTNFFLNKFN